VPSTETILYQPQGLEEALAEYEMAREEGRPLDRNAFLARHAHLAEQLTPLLAAAERIDTVADPVRQALGARPVQSFTGPSGYEILEKLGEGGMGVVWKARQHGTEQTVALKMLRADWLQRLDSESRQAALDQFRVEARAAARLRHPNRVRILHQGEYEDVPYYVMELIEGISLAEKLKSPDGVSREAALKYLAGVAEAVHEAHQRGIVHQDIKPHNILIDAVTDEALLTDFGLATLAPLDVPSSVCKDSVSHEARQARLAGTLPYMSPEQTCPEQPVTHSSDIYSLGATLYQVLVGTPPFQGQTKAELIGRIRNQTPIPLRKQQPGLSPEMETICLRCLRKDPAERYPTALELGQALRSCLETVRFTRYFTTTATGWLILGPVVMLLTAIVFALIHIRFYEPVIWLTIFSAYLALFVVMVPIRRFQTKEESYQLIYRAAWAVWGGKMITMVAVGVMLRWTFADRPEQALRLLFPVAAALNGMVAFINETIWIRRHYAWAIVWWLAGVGMVFVVEWAPLIYGLLNLLACTAVGFILLRMRQEWK